MSQWISIEAAAEKYRLEKEYIWLWVEMKKITVSYENDTVSIDDDSIQQFIKRLSWELRLNISMSQSNFAWKKTKPADCSFTLEYAGSGINGNQRTKFATGRFMEMVEEQYERLRSFEKNSMSDKCYLQQLLDQKDMQEIETNSIILL